LQNSTRFSVCCIETFTSAGWPYFLRLLHARIAREQPSDLSVAANWHRTATRRARCHGARPGLAGIAAAADVHAHVELLKVSVAASGSNASERKFSIGK